MRRRNNRKILAMAAPAILVGLMIHNPGLVDSELRLTPAGSPEIHVDAEDGAWRSVTEAPVQFAFLFEAAVSGGTVRDLAFGVPGVHVAEGGTISADGPAARLVQVEPAETIQRWVRLEVRGDALPVYGNAAVAACNDLMAEGASTENRHRTEITARARAAMSVAPAGWRALSPTPVVDTDTVDITIGVICEAENKPTRTSDATASGNGTRHG